MRSLQSTIASLTAVVFAAVLAAFLVAGCGSGGHQAGNRASTDGESAPPGSPPSGSSSVIVIKNFAYQPSTLDVPAGAEVTVKNEDTAIHTVTAVGPHSGAFGTGDIEPGSTKTFRAPTTPGTYPYICTIHQFMHGTLVVH